MRETTLPWHTAYNESLHFIELTYTGTVSKDELIASAAACAALINQHQNSRVLGDCSALQGGHSLADLYYLSEWVAGLRLPRFREAMILQSEVLSSESVQFWQTTCTNRGLNVRAFEDRETALQWLLREN